MGRKIKMGIATALPKIQPGQEAEYHKATDILVYEPSLELSITSVNPSGNLFEGPLSPEKARLEHRKFRRALESTGARVHELKEIIEKGAQNSEGKEKLLALARASLQYNIDVGVSLDGKQKLSEEHEEVLQVYTNKELIELIVSQPTSYIQNSSENHMEFLSHNSYAALSNLMFMRDQMITTPKKVVMSRMSSTQRHSEPGIVKLALGYLGIEPHELPKDCRLEGGDFLGAGSLQLIGFGPEERGARTNRETIDHFVENQSELFGNLPLAVIEDPQADQQHMHLDTYANIVTENVAMLSESRYGDGKDKPKVAIYQYGKLVEEGMTITDLLKERGFEIAVIPEKLQQDYGINVVTTGDRFVAVDIAAKHELDNNQDHIENQELYDKILKDAGIDSKRIQVVMNHINRAYGGPHCLTQVIRRETE